MPSVELRRLCSTYISSPGHKDTLYAKGYQDGKDNGALTNSAFVGRKALDFVTLDVCKHNLLQHANPAIS